MRQQKGGEVSWFKWLVVGLVSFGLSCGFTQPLPQVTANGSTQVPINNTGNTCTLLPGSKTCADSTPCKTDPTGASICLAGVTPPPGGFNVTQTCWQYSYGFSCQNPTMTDSCTAYESNPNCKVVGSTCADTITETGVCDDWNYTYQCQTQAAVTSQQLTCSNGITVGPNSQTFNASVLTTPANTNNTFLNAAIASEIANEGQSYAAAGELMFYGTPENCTKGYFGIKNCCKTAPGAQSNSQIAGLVFANGLQVAKYSGQMLIDTVSPYAYDAMYNLGIWTTAMDTAMVMGQAGNVGTSLASGGLTLGAYGLSYVSSGSFVDGSGLFGGNIQIGSDFADGGFLEFNPYILAAEIAVTVITDLMKCSSGEQLLALHRGADLSVFVGESCSQRIPIIGTCIQWTDSFCSFNTILAKIINEQGKPQLGLSVNDCTGLTPAQLSQINFSLIDFSEFTASLKNQATNGTPTNASIKANYTPIMQATTSGAAQSPKSPVLPTYPTNPSP